MNARMIAPRFGMRAVVWLTSLIALAAAHYARAQEPVVDPPGRVARLSLMDGEVSMAPAGTEEWADAVLNRPVTSGDRLWVGTDGRAELQIGTASVHLDRSTGFEFIELDDDVMQMSLTEGVANIRVRTLGDRDKVQIETPNATVTLLHPGEYTVQIDPDSDRTIVRTRNGEAEVSGASKSFRVRANEEGTFTGLDGLTANVGSLSNRTAFENWANDRDRRGDESQSARYVSREVVGYEDLDGQGDWIDEPEYGYVWRPSYVVADWAPYRYGRWAYVAPWGWTWIDNAPWGYAPFHYGRWAFVRQRWCWVPGPRHLRPYYAPAVVGWVGGPSVSVSVGFGSGVGWFPLGPREVFVPWYRHTPRYVRHVNVSNTIIVNNITNIYNRRGYVPRYSNSAISRAVTIAQRDAFVSGRPVGNHRVQVSDRDLRQWRTNVRPNSIAPDRESIAAGQPRRQAPPPAAFARENPKNVRGDFRASRVAAEQIKRAQGRQPNIAPEQRIALREPSRDAQSAQDRQAVERVQSMRGREQNDRGRDQNDRRQQQNDRPQNDVRARDNDTPRARERTERPPVQALQGNSDPRDSVQRDNSRSRPAERSFQRREEPVKRDQPRNQDQPRAREWNPPDTRQAPVERREAPVERRAAPVEREQPRFEPRRSEPPRETRSSPAPRAPEASSPPRSNNNRGNSNSNQGGSGARVSRDRPNSQPD